MHHQKKFAMRIMMQVSYKVGITHITKLSRLKDHLAPDILVCLLDGMLEGVSEHANLVHHHHHV